MRLMLIGGCVMLAALHTNKALFGRKYLGINDCIWCMATDLSIDQTCVLK